MDRSLGHPAHRERQRGQVGLSRHGMTHQAKRDALDRDPSHPRRQSLDDQVFVGHGGETRG
jgi:hypothetical protein